MQQQRPVPINDGLWPVSTAWMSSKVAQTLQPYQGTSMWLHSGQPMPEAIESVAKARDLPWCAGKVANVRRRRKRYYTCFCAFGLLLTSMLAFVLFDSPFCKEDEASTAQTDGLTPNNSSSNNSSIEVNDSMPVNESAFEHDSPSCRPQRVLIVLICAVSFHFAMFGIFFCYAFGVWSLRKAQYQIDPCDRELRNHVQLLHVLYLSDQLSKTPAFELESDSVSVGMPHKGTGKADGFACGEDREPLSHGGEGVFSCTVAVGVSDVSGGPASHGDPGDADVGGTNSAACDEPPAQHAAVIEVWQDGSITYSIDDEPLSSPLSWDIGW